MPLCSNYCVPQWTADGKSLAVVDYAMEGAKTIVFSLGSPDGLPKLPAAGIQDIKQLKDAKIVSGAVVFGPTAELTATVRVEVHRNLYRVPLQ